ncbi:MAG: DNA-binding response regulator [Chloroflexi bacterium]|nr:MAG: DNA-binding response regulator [Chloroflexota bacterium]
MMNQRPLRVLIADNLPEFLHTRAEFLQKAGYDVLLAETPEETVDLLDTHHIHIAILDIRMRDNDDEKDISGITLAKDPRFRHIPKIILTNFPVYKHVRDVLGPSFASNLPPAVDFIAKNEGAEAMVRAVQQTEEKHVKINRHLQFKWDSYLSFAQLLLMLKPIVDETFRNEHIQMVEDLFRQLFYRYVHVSFGPMLRHESERLLLTLSAFDASDRETQYLVSFGCLEAVVREESRYQHDVPEQARSSLDRYQTVHSRHYAAIAYTFNGGDLEQTQSLRNLLRQHDSERILLGLTHLYQSHLPLWHDRGRAYLDDSPLVSFFSERLADVGDLQEKIESICRQLLSMNLADIFFKPANLVFQVGNGGKVLPNPIAYAAKLSEIPLTAVHWGSTNNQVTIDTVLFDKQGKPWLIDYAYAGQAPLLIDFVSLEMSILSEVLPQLDLLTAFQVEELLLTSNSLDEPIDPSNLPQQAHFLITALTHIRQAAARRAGCDLTAYETGRFVVAMQTLAQFNSHERYRRTPLRPFLNALLTASLSSQKLWIPTPPVAMPSGETGLWVDMSNEIVWVSGQPIELTVQEYQIISFMYQRAGQLCERREIVEHALGERYDETFGQDESRLNSAMSRLRQKLEPDPAHPQFLKTVRGRGYRLDLPAEH